MLLSERSPERAEEASQARKRESSKEVTQTEGAEGLEED